jgi:integrase
MYFKTYCEERKVKTVEAVSVKVLREYMLERFAAAAFATLKTEKGMLAPIWSQAVRDGLIGKNPWLEVVVPGKAGDATPIFWTREEVASLLAETDGWLHDLVVLGVNTGLRIAAMCGLEWRDISFERSVITCRVELSKSGRAYRVPMSAAANEVLGRRFAAKAGGELILCQSNGKRLRPANSYEAIRAAVKRAKVTDHGHYNHILRHTFASHAIMAGVPLAVVSAWLGHRSLKTTEVYAHLIPSESDRRMQELDRTGALTPPALGTSSPPANGHS